MKSANEIRELKTLEEKKEIEESLNKQNLDLIEELIIENNNAGNNEILLFSNNKYESSIKCLKEYLVELGYKVNYKESFFANWEITISW